MYKSFTQSLTVLTFLTTACVAMASDNCDISGLDKVVVVRALWTASLVAPAAKRFTPDLAARTEISDEDIHEALSYDYIDYLNCRLMKVSLKDDSFNSHSYNKDNGSGAAEKIIATLKNDMRAAEKVVPILKNDDDAQSNNKCCKIS